MGAFTRFIRNVLDIISLVGSTVFEVLRISIWERTLRQPALVLLTTVIFIASALTMVVYLYGVVGGVVGGFAGMSPNVAAHTGLSRLVVAVWGTSDSGTRAALPTGETSSDEPIEVLPTRTVSEATRLFYYVNTKGAFRSLEANAHRIDILAPQTYFIDKWGYLNGSVDDRVKRLARDRGIKLLPLVTNKDFSREIAHDLLTDPAKRTRLIGALLNEAEKEGYMGFQLDFENLADEHRPYLNSFIEEMAERFEEGDKIASIAVMSKWNAFINPEFDYRNIGKHAHLITVMSYDQHYRGSDPGPIAGIDWVDRVATYVARTMPPEKVLLGIPLYFRHWGGSPSSGTYSAAMAMASSNEAPIWFNDENKSPHFVYQDEDGRDHNVWFENKESFAYKAELGAKHGFQGFSVWRLGQEDPGVWDYLDEVSDAESVEVDVGP